MWGPWPVPGARGRTQEGAVYEARHLGPPLVHGPLGAPEGMVGAAPAVPARHRPPPVVRHEEDHCVVVVAGLLGCCLVISSEHVLLLHSIVMKKMNQLPPDYH